jgi:hypothetical protein
VADTGASGGGPDTERHILRHHGSIAYIAAYFGGTVSGKSIP